MWRIWVAITVALLGLYETGVALAIINTMFEAFSEDLEIDKDVGGAVLASVLFLGAAIGGLISGPFEKLFSKFAQFVLGLLFTTGAILCALTTKRSFCWEGSIDGCVPYMAFIGRLISGIATGLIFVISPKFLAEILPPNIRRRSAAAAQVTIAIGIFVGYLIGLPFEFDDFDIEIEWWRVMFYFQAAFGVLHMALAIWIFPSYGVSREEVRKSLKNVSSAKVDSPELSKDEEVSPEMENPNPKAPPLTNESLGHPKRNFFLFLQPEYRRSTLLGIGVPIACQIIGGNVVDSYSTIIFDEAGFKKPVVGSIILGLTLLCGGCLSIFIFDRFGRISIVVWSFLGMGFSFLGLAISSLAVDSVSGPLSLLFVLSFTLSYAAGCGGLTVAYAPEVVPPETAGIVLGTGQSLSLLVCLLLVLIFPSMEEAIGTHFAFLTLSVITFTCLVFLKIFMIETKDRELDDIIMETRTIKKRKQRS